MVKVNKEQQLLGERFYKIYKYIPNVRLLYIEIKYDKQTVAYDKGSDTNVIKEYYSSDPIISYCGLYFTKSAKELFKNIKSFFYKNEPIKIVYRTGYSDSYKIYKIKVS